MRARFEAAHHGRRAARARRLDRRRPEGALALLLLLDQIPRNIYRGTAHAFAADPLALRSRRGGARRRAWTGRSSRPLRLFFYLPFEHSRAAWRTRIAAWRWPRPGATRRRSSGRCIHHDIIARFGRFPHRNAALGRDRTAEERAFLEGGGFAG